MDTNVKFSSTRFLPALPEQVQLSPRHYGFELAHFLATALANRGVVTSYPLQSEWSWYVEYKDESCSFAAPISKTVLPNGCVFSTRHRSGRWN